MPSDYASANGAAYVAVNLIQNDHAASGQMTISVDGANLVDCEAATEGLEPWSGFCREAVEQGYSTIMSAPAEITRVSVTKGDRVSPVGPMRAFRPKCRKRRYMSCS